MYLNLPVIGSLVYYEIRSLDHAATNAELSVSTKAVRSPVLKDSSWQKERSENPVKFESLFHTCLWSCVTESHKATHCHTHPLRELCGVFYEPHFPPLSNPGGGGKKTTKTTSYYPGTSPQECMKEGRPRCKGQKFEGCDARESEASYAGVVQPALSVKRANKRPDDAEEDGTIRHQFANPPTDPSSDTFKTDTNRMLSYAALCCAKTLADIDAYGHALMHPEEEQENISHYVPTDWSRHNVQLDLLRDMCGGTILWWEGVILLLTTVFTHLDYPSRALGCLWHPPGSMNDVDPKHLDKRIGLGYLKSKYKDQPRLLDYRLMPLALLSESLKPILWDGESHGVASQSTKVSFRANEKGWITGSELAFAWRESGKQFGKNHPSSPDRDLNLDLPVLGGLAQHDWHVSQLRHRDISKPKLQCPHCKLSATMRRPLTSAMMSVLLPHDVTDVYRLVNIAAICKFIDGPPTRRQKEDYHNTSLYKGLRENKKDLGYEKLVAYLVYSYYHGHTLKGISLVSSSLLKTRDLRLEMYRRMKQRRWKNIIIIVEPSHGTEKTHAERLKKNGCRQAKRLQHIAKISVSNSCEIRAEKRRHLLEVPAGQLRTAGLRKAGAAAKMQGVEGLHDIVEEAGQMVWACNEDVGVHEIVEEARQMVWACNENVGIHEIVEEARQMVWACNEDVGVHEIVEEARQMSERKSEGVNDKGMEGGVLILSWGERQRKLMPLALLSASLKPILWDGGWEGEKRGVASQPTKVSFRAKKSRWFTETVDDSSYRTGLVEKS
uniref:Uncharacterized protein n=1 Tax=Timema tahoe TaxID=61484 RepID=A0A7R9FJB7_9NEOP|nr:unnamed protein product [Timema tahoe]